MKRFKNILVCCDVDSQQQTALNRAVQLAKHNAARLTVVDVVEELPVLLSILSKRAKQLEENVVHGKSRALKKLVEPIRRQKIDVSSEILCGRSFSEIIREVLRNGHDLVMKNVTADFESSRSNFGPGDMRLLRACPCPVWLVRPTERGLFERILAAVDPGDAADRVHQILNEQIMELASSLAQSEGGELFVAHAWMPYGEGLLRSYCGPRVVAEYVKETEIRSRALLDQFLEKYGKGINREAVFFVRGHPGDIIPRIARSKAADLLVMGTVARSGISGFLIGNTAEQILNQVSCSVLAFKPEGFVSPVTLD
jgi:universal stress protein E